ncbi:MAG: alpha-glucuronidase [Chitinophagaceae bacterium]|nr:alpha-glucuronidase [Chitinophagaceae bacterium]
MRGIFFTIALWALSLSALAESGYHLWLRYAQVQNAAIKNSYRLFSSVSMKENSPTRTIIRKELERAFIGLTGYKLLIKNDLAIGNGIVIGLFAELNLDSFGTPEELKRLGNEGFKLKSVTISGKTQLFIGANTDIGLLYGVFRLLQIMSSEQPLANLSIESKPRLQLRMLNHWDNLNRTVERGYAGNSIWNWHTLPDYVDDRYVDYARANASIGINAVSLTNVNANATVLTPAYLQKVKAMADLFRPYGIKVFLTARFSAPIEIGGLQTADPLNAQVKDWWMQKAAEIYSQIPDFGGFLVKANSEGQPGPQNYGRNHVDGANMLAAALQPHNGLVIWRAFVYSNETPEDRYKQPYQEFVPLDGQFASNVLLQVKNGAIDFQPREPFHPLFGAMQKTPVMMEFQLTQEYLGFATHLVYLAPMFREVLDADTYRPYKGSSVARVIDGSSFDYKHTGMAGVANIGSDLNWTGHPFAQANWYALGRLAWNPDLSSETIADEWIAQTLTTNPQAKNIIKRIMLQSHENAVNYMTPLGLHHIMGYGHHYGPAPWFNKASREDWNCTYFHRADTAGIGFDRTKNGSNALSQYAEPIQQKWENINTIDDKWLAWFHHVPWQFTMDNGQTFWANLSHKYQEGVNGVRAMQQLWQSVQQHVNEAQFKQVTMLLHVQQQEAVWWKDACLSYFQTFSKLPLPKGVEPPLHTLQYYQSLSFPYAPGNGH